MESSSNIVYHPKLTKPDRVVLQNLEADIEEYANSEAFNFNQDGGRMKSGSAEQDGSDNIRDQVDLDKLNAWNNPKSVEFEPTVFVGIDLDQFAELSLIKKWLLEPYVRVARSIVRVPTDVVMLTHLILYFTTSVPSAILLFLNFTWIHGLLHFAMQFYYMGTYTLMMHQHIHMRGILAKRFAVLDTIFPYITDPLMGHTWNTYYWHHVKHHHVEGNGPHDLSSTIRLQRDNPLHFACYVGRFFWLIWFDLPLYFLRKGKPTEAMRAAFWELCSYSAIYSLYRITSNSRAVFCVFLLPLLLLRVGLMVGNWGQHAFVDDEEPDSDFRSSITLIDVASNRFCYNDGYHTSHHLNPLRHWREHPVSFLKNKHIYAAQGALVFHDIDYIMITVKVLMKDYEYLARRLVPIGNQRALSIEERIALLKRHTRQFTEDEVRLKFKKS